MKITEKNVTYVAALANLEVSEQETAQLAADLNSILGHMEKLNELDTANVEPMTQVTHFEKDNSTLRPDLARPCFSQEQAVANAPESGAGQFKVPKVIER